jgi:DNA ligase (NAD+)
MNKDLIKKKYKKKIKKINYYNKRYYNDNISEITDSEYDDLKKNIINLEKKYTYLKLKDSPSNTKLRASLLILSMYIFFLNL